MYKSPGSPVPVLVSLSVALLRAAVSTADKPVAVDVAPAVTWPPTSAGARNSDTRAASWSSQQLAGCASRNVSVHLVDSCFSNVEATQFRAELEEVMTDKPDVQLLFFYLNLQVGAELFYPGLCCWNHDKSDGDGETPLAWVWWRDLSGKAYLDMSLQHVDMWMLPLVTMQRNVHIISNQTLVADGNCWKRRSSSRRQRDIAELLSAVIQPLGDGSAESGLCWREQTAAFHPLSTLLWGALSPWGVSVLQYHQVNTNSAMGSSKHNILEPQWTIEWMTFMLRCLLYTLALVIPLPILLAWERVCELATVERTEFCMHENAQLLNCQRSLRTGILDSPPDWLQLGSAEHAVIRSALDPHHLPCACLLFSWQRVQSIRVWFAGIVAMLVVWQLFCVWWMSGAGSIDMCERCLPAAKHKLLAAMLVAISLYVGMHLPQSRGCSSGETPERQDSDTAAPTHSNGAGRVNTQPCDSETRHSKREGPTLAGDTTEEKQKQQADDNDDEVDASHKFRITLRTLSLTYLPQENSPVDCDLDLTVDQHGAPSFLDALHDALMLSTGVLAPAGGNHCPQQQSLNASILHKTGAACKWLVASVIHVMTIVRVSPLFLSVSMLLQSNSYLSAAQHENSDDSNRAAACRTALFKALNVAVFVFMWCFIIWLMHDLFHILAYGLVGFVINAKLFVPWLVLLLSLGYQLKVARNELYQPFVAVKATVVEEYIRDDMADKLCSRTVEHIYSTLVLRLVTLLAGSFKDCRWEARALRSVRTYDTDACHQLQVVFRARVVKVVVKWLLFACAIQLLLLLLSSVYGIETMPAYLQLLARVAPLGLTWMVSLTNHNPLLMIRMLQASHARSIINDMVQTGQSAAHECPCLAATKAPQEHGQNSHEHTKVE
eukprot:scpid33730/ scgid31520/ 